MLLAALCACLVVSAARAQTATVRAFVTDTADRKPLQGVNVVLRDAAGVVAGAATDGDGYAVLTRLPPGRYALRATFVGYAAHEDTLALAAGAVETLRLALTAGEAELDEVLVAAERATGATAITAGLETVRPADIERVPMLGVSGDLAAYLHTTPGAVSSGDRGGQLFLRGGEATQNLVFLDGIPVYQPFHILGFYSAFPADVIDAADVYAGGFGARYGGRLSSVLDVRARNGNKQRVDGAASVAPFLSTLRLEGPLVPNKVSFLASVRQSLVEQLVPTLFEQRLDYRFGDRFAKLHALPNASTSVSVTALHTSDRGNLAGTFKDPLGDVEDVPEAERDSSEVAWDNLALGARLGYLPARLPLLAELSGWISQMDTRFGLEADPEREASVEAFGGELNLTFFAGEAQLRAGAFAQRAQLAYTLGGVFQEIDASEERQTEGGVYAEVEVPVGPSLRLTPGVRVHAFFDRHATRVEPRLRAVWRPGGRLSGQQWSAAWGLYHQVVVGLTDERDVGNVFTAWAASTLDEVPRAMHVILGWRLALPARGLDLALEGYHKRLSHLALPAWSVLPAFTTTLEPGRGVVWGLDARIEVNREGFYGYAGYGLASVEYVSEQEAFSVWFGEPQQRYRPPHDLRHQVNAVARYRLGTLALSARWQYGSGLPYTRSIGFDDWLLLTGSDVDLHREPGQVRVLYDRPYRARLPAYHRLDLWLERTFERERVNLIVRAGAVNVYDRANLFYFDLFTLRRVDQLPLTPSVGLKLEIK